MAPTLPTDDPTCTTTKGLSLTVAVVLCLACAGVPQLGPTEDAPRSPLAYDDPSDPGNWVPIALDADVGDCLRIETVARGRETLSELAPEGAPPPLATVPCSAPHHQEVVAVLPLEEPGLSDVRLDDLADGSCSEAFERYVGRAPEDSRSAVSWHTTAGGVVCAAHRTQPFTGSVRDD